MLVRKYLISALLKLRLISYLLGQRLYSTQYLSATNVFTTTLALMTLSYTCHSASVPTASISPVDLKIGVQALQYVTSESDTSCHYYSQKERDVSQYPNLKTNIEKSIIDLEEKVEKEILKISNYELTKKALENQYNVEQLTLQEKYAERDQFQVQQQVAMRAYKKCLSENSSEACQQERFNLLEINSKLAKLNTIYIPDLENSLAKIEYDINEINTDISQAHGATQEYKDGIIQHQNTLSTIDTLINDHLKSYSNISTTLLIDIYSSLNPQPTPEESIQKMEFTLFDDTAKVSPYGGPLNIRHAESPLSLTQSSSIDSMSLLWDITYPPNDKQQEFLDLLKLNNNWVSIKSGHDLGCKILNNSQSNDLLAGMVMETIITTAEKVTLLNTYEVSINLKDVVTALKFAGNEFRYLTSDQLQTLLSTDINGFDITVLSEVDNTEYETLYPRLKYDFIHKLLKVIALRSPKRLDSNCSHDTLYCSTNGWWIADALSPVKTSHSLEMAEDEPPWSLILSGQIYLSSQNHHVITPNLPPAPTCPDGEIEQDGTCVPDCPVNQEPNDGVCTDPEPPACEDDQVIVDGVCTDPTPPTCEDGQVIVDGVCSDPTPPTCENGQIIVDGVCTDPTPPTCEDGQIIVDGVCTDPTPPTCEDGQVIVDGVCTHLQNDACPIGQERIGGVCWDIETSCPDGEILIEGQCF